MKTVPATLQTHLDGDGTTLCFLLKITATNGSVLGVTSLDQDVTYDDGAGSVTYQAAIGVDQSALETTSDLEVDNSEAVMLIADTGPFTPQSIEAGVLDYAEFVVYRVNWKDLAQGHYIPPGGYGTIGKVIMHDTLSGVAELRGLPQQLKQNYVDLYSITCRARFGSGGGGTGSCLQTGQCGFDAESLWQNHSIVSVGTENDRVFTANATPAVNGPNGALTFAPGLVEWLTGDNAGLTSEVEATNGAEITLRFGTPYTIQSSDTFKIRPDCDKTHTTCKADYDNLLNFRGEWTIPLADESAQSVPSFHGTWNLSERVGDEP